MRKSQNHIIEKVLLEVNTNRMDKAEELKNNINSFLEIHLFPKIEILFDEYGDDTIYRFEKIELNLSVDKWENIQVIPTEITRQLSAEIEINKPGENEKSEHNRKNISETINSRELLLFFLDNGYLPWYGTAGQLGNFYKPEKAEEFFTDMHFAKQIGKLVEKNEIAFRRLVYQFPAELTLNFLIFINPRLSEYRKTILTYLNRLDVNLRFYILYLVYTVNIEIDKEKNVLEIRKILAHIKDLQNAPEFLAFNNFMQKIIIASEKAEPGKIKKIFDTFSTRHLADNSGSDNEVLKSEKSAEEVEDFVNQEDFFQEVGSQELILQNAGMVILHPFLSQFFLILEITNNEGSILKERGELAVQVMHYLAKGDEYFFEGNMVFEKFLCNYPLEMPVRRESLLNEAIRNESNLMLQEVIRQWPALKNTSPDGLRHMFLQRNGKLIKKDKNFKLIMERKAQDVLLEKLSWNITVIKLPWNRELLFVEW